MEWTTIVGLIVSIFSSVGGISGFIAIYHAKSNKDTIDINNVSKMLEDSRKERKLLSEEYHKYKTETDAKINNLYEIISNMKDDKAAIIAAINLGYQCPRIHNANECIVLQQYLDNIGFNCFSKTLKENHKENKKDE